MGKKSRLKAMSRISSGQRPPAAVGVPPYIASVERNGIAVNTGRLPIPERSYDADCGWSETRGGAVSLMFGKRHRDDPDRLRSRLEIRLPVGAFCDFWKHTIDFHTKLLQSFRDEAVFGESPAKDPRTMPADKDHSEWATIAVVAHGGGSAQMDFFNLPQGDLFLYQKAGDTRRLEIQPVVRIFTTTPVLVQVLNDAKRLAEEIDKRLSSRIEKEAAP